MAKVMLFIDGTWLYASTPKLAESYGKPDFQVDFGRLPLVLAQQVGKQLGLTDVDVVRTYLFGSYASNYDLRDEESVQRRLDFFSVLKEDYHYELEVFPINFRGYDIAIAVLGDQDFKPVLQHVRRLGKRVAIASIKGRCAPEFADPRDEARVKDFDIIWLDDLLHELEFKHERRQLQCESPMHKGDRRVWTTFRPRRGQKSYCEDCRSEFAKQKQEAQREFVASQVEPVGPVEVNETAVAGQVLTGAIQKKVSDRGYGFIRIADGKEYFFHFTDLQAGLDFQDAQDGLRVDFEVKKEPSQGKAGAAQKVRRHGGQSSGL